VRNPPPKPKQGVAMIMFTSVNLNEILKKRKDTHGNVKYAQSVMLINYGAMASSRHILMGLLTHYFYAGTDALCAVQ